MEHREKVYGELDLIMVDELYETIYLHEGEFLREELNFFVGFHCNVCHHVACVFRFQGLKQQ